jgi:putative nucleotidyltransferase with HDIG domain
MAEPTGVPAYDELLRRFAAAVRARQLYAPEHPLVTRSVGEWLTAIRALHQPHPSLSFGIVDKEFVAADMPLPRVTASMSDLLARLTAHGIERVTIDRGVTPPEIEGFIASIAALGPRPAAGQEGVPSSQHIRVGRITQEDRTEGGVASDMAAIRQLYAKSVTAAQVVWESAGAEGVPDVPAALEAIEGLTDAVTHNRTALVALTAIRNYDNYTFTHMVNVSILAMGQARALGIEGRLLREFGLSALMHDIGKIKTPQEILNKPDKLTDDEMTIMRRHVVDGAEILRRTPEMPVLAPVVAFEHHLRLDGSGYPFGVTRSSLNVATMLCSIADVYDAMRSQRAYQQSFPSERILEVLKRADGRQFDQNLIRRFVQLLGIYPPGTLVKLKSGEVAVVTRVHAPDPHRPRVRVLFTGDGAAVHGVVERSLWREDDETAGGARGGIVSPLDPRDYDVDPLAYVPMDVRPHARPG